MRLFWLKVRRSLWASALAGKNKIRGGASRSKTDGGKANPQGIKFAKHRQLTSRDGGETLLWSLPKLSGTQGITLGPPPGPSKQHQTVVSTSSVGHGPSSLQHSRPLNPSNAEPYIICLSVSIRNFLTCALQIFAGRQASFPEFPNEVRRTIQA